jgi:hypothetical protein
VYAFIKSLDLDGLQTAGVLGIDVPATALAQAKEPDDKI